MHVNIVMVCYDYRFIDYCVFDVGSAGTAALYQFSANPCFNATANVRAVGFEVVFPASNLIEYKELSFDAFMTKDKLVKNISVFDTNNLLLPIKHIRLFAVNDKN